MSDKSFEPSTFESRWYSHWEGNGLFKPSGDASKPAYNILLPPPNDTGRATASQVNVPLAANGIATPTATSASAG